MEKNSPKIALNAGGDYYSTVIGNTPLPLNKVTSWSIKVLKSRGNNGGGIYIGVAPSDIDQDNDNNHYKCGWYFGCYDSRLWSGQPYNYRGKEYGPRKEVGRYVHMGDTIGIVVDTTEKSVLSLVLNGMNIDFAYE